MSAETQEALHAALRAHIPGTDAGLDELFDAAEAHAESARSYEEVAAEYEPLTEPGADPDPVKFAELAEELQAIRVAHSIIAGGSPLPGEPPIISTGD